MLAEVGPKLPTPPRATPLATDDRTTEIEALLRQREMEPRTHTFARLADLHREAGDLDLALDLIRGGLEHHPYYLDARLVHARVLLELRRDDAARAEFEQILTLDPTNPLARFALGLDASRPAPEPAPPASAWLEQVEEAWRQAQAEAPPPEPTPPESTPPESTPPESALPESATPEPTPPEPGGQAVETVTLAALYAGQGLFDRAVEVYERMLARDPDNAGLLAAMTETRRLAEEGDAPPRDPRPAPVVRPARVAEEEVTIRRQLEEILDGAAPSASSAGGPRRSRRADADAEGSG